MPDAQRRPWLTVALLFFCAGLNYGDRTAISSVFPLLQVEFGMTNVQLGELGSFFLWSYALGSPFAGMLADRFSRRMLIAGSLAAWSLATLATGFAQSTTPFSKVRNGLLRAVTSSSQSSSMKPSGNRSRLRRTAPLSLRLHLVQLGEVGVKHHLLTAK